jgi:hypothetical protein
MWMPRLIDDRQYLGGPRSPQSYKAVDQEFIPEKEKEEERRRSQQYSELRFHLPVCDVMPSLIAGQHNEVRLWIEHHYTQKYDEQKDAPVEVTWSAGPRHHVVTVKDDPRFCATLHYYGPMLVQAKLRFKDGHVAYGYVYARRNCPA